MTATPRPGTPRQRPSAPPAAPEPLRLVDAASRRRIETARARIAAGWYDRDEVKDSLVDLLLEELRRR